MAILPETQNIKYSSLPFKDAEEHSVVLHLAAEIDRPFLPIPFSMSQEKTDFLDKLKKLSKELEAKYPKINVRIFKLKLSPPGRVKDIYDKVKRPIVEAHYDVAFMAICNDAETGKQVQEDPNYKEIHDMFKSKKNHHVVVAKNIRKAGETHVHDKFDQGVYLFNYFYVEDTEFDFGPVWDFTGCWFVDKTGLDNSYLLKPVSGDQHFQYINHCYWHRLTEFVPQLIFQKKSMKEYVLDNFSYNNAVAFPLIYEIVKTQ